MGRCTHSQSIAIPSLSFPTNGERREYASRGHEHLDGSDLYRSPFCLRRSYVFSVFPILLRLTLP